MKSVMTALQWSDSSSLVHSYLVMPFMGTDLGKLMKLERLSEDRVQFLVYQMLKGLKVNTATDTHACMLLITSNACLSGVNGWKLCLSVLKKYKFVPCWVEVADVVCICSLLSTSTQRGSSTGCVNFDLSDYELWGWGSCSFSRHPIHPVSHTGSFALCVYFLDSMIRCLLDFVIEMSHMYMHLSLTLPTQ